MVVVELDKSFYFFALLCWWKLIRSRAKKKNIKKKIKKGFSEKNGSVAFARQCSLGSCLVSHVRTSGRPPKFERAL
jgi:hypothetical protein